jgi:prevent-host-death family protein
MRVASVTEVASDFAVYLKASEHGPVVVTRHGKPVAVLLRAGDQEDLERLLMGHSPKLQAILEGARKRFRAGPVSLMKPSGKKSRRRTPAEARSEVREKMAELAAEVDGGRGLESLSDDDPGAVMRELRVEELTIRELLAVHAGASAELRRRGLCRSANNPIADLAEWLVAQAFQLDLGEKSTAGFDAKSRTTGEKYEIKARRLSPASRPTHLAL